MNDLLKMSFNRIHETVSKYGFPPLYVVFTIDILLKFSGGEILNKLHNFINIKILKDIYKVLMIPYKNYGPLDGPWILMLMFISVIILYWLYQNDSKLLWSISDILDNVATNGEKLNVFQFVKNCWALLWLVLTKLWIIFFTIHILIYPTGTYTNLANQTPTSILLLLLNVIMLIIYIGISMLRPLGKRPEIICEEYSHRDSNFYLINSKFKQNDPRTRVKYKILKSKRESDFILIQINSGDSMQILNISSNLEEIKYQFDNCN